MRPEFIPFKYKNIKPEYLYTEKNIISIGWKCRKYVRWNDVHVDDDDRDRLKKFGDTAVEKKVICTANLSRVNEILLNVQKWRLDKDLWSIEPEHRNCWEKCRALIQASNTSPKIVINILNERFGDISKIADNVLYTSFLKLILFDLLLVIYNLEDLNIKESDITGSIDCFINKLETAGIESYELNLLKKKLSIKDLLEMIGFEDINDDLDVSKYRDDYIDSEVIINVIEENLAISKLYELRASKGVQTIYLNKKNNCIKTMHQSKEMEDFIIKFFTAYSKTVDDNPTISRYLEDFNSYLALNLNREFN